MNAQFWWFLARSSGIVAWAALSASVLWGIVLATDLFPQHRRPAWLLDLHRWLGGLTIGFLGIHVGALLADSYVAFGPADVLVPFASAWKPVPVALGVLAMWALVVVQGTSLAMKRLPRRVWRRIHLLSYGAFWLTSLHGTFAGTDASRLLYLVPSTLSVLAVAGGVAYRVLHGKGRQRPRGADIGTRRTAGA